MADEGQYSSGPDSGSHKRKYDDQGPPSSVGRRSTGFSSPDSAPPPSYNSVPPPLDGIEMAKQRAQEIAARLTAASAGAEAKRPRVENGSGGGFDNEKGFMSAPSDIKHMSSSAPSAIPVSYGSYHGTSKKIDIPQNRVGVIIGKAGETIKYLQLQSGAKIQVQRDMDADPNSVTRPVELMGTAEQIAKAEQLINDVLAEAEAGGSGIVSRRLTGHAGSEHFEMKIPNNKVGLVIGKGGETIKNMQARTGARIQVIPLHLPPGDTSTERTLHIDGTSEQIKTARELVDEVISEVCLDVILGGNVFLELKYSAPLLLPGSLVLVLHGKTIVVHLGKELTYGSLNWLVSFLKSYRWIYSITCQIQTVKVLPPQMLGYRAINKDFILLLLVFLGFFFSLCTHSLQLRRGWASAGVKHNIPSDHTMHILFRCMCLCATVPASNKSELNRMRNPAMAGGYQQQGYQARPPANWGQGAPQMQQPGYGYMQPGAYPGPSPQYNMSQPPYGGYPSQPSSGGYASGWDQSAIPPNQQSSSAGGYDYYNQQPSSHQQQTPGGSAAPTDNSGYHYSQPPASGYMQPGQGYAQDGYGGYHAPPQSGYGQPASYEQQGYGSAQSYGSATNPTQEGHTPSYGGQGDAGQAPTSTQPSAVGQQGYNTSQVPSPNPGSYPPQGSTQPSYSQSGYGSQPPAQSGYGPGYGPPQGQKPLVNHPAYGQTQQSPTTPGSYGQAGYQSQPPSSGYGQAESGSQRPQSSTYGGAAAAQPGYGAPPYAAQYNASYSSYSQPPAYPSDSNASGGTRGTYEATPAAQTGQQGGAGNASPRT
ncbi:hypothetical protein CXB51_013128 [Gossypium anomalum]|uniref:K Homology domain-containing protein n=1 Tax=Gossypium anomalum TaxID=47600 RepID=A0A8J6D1Q3_9ROSI|nr:hypothetical protein CXB51_013128 [Gossypium anomalum]